jgi:hypothetical protein
LLDWFASKIAMGVAVLILISAVFGFFAFLNSRTAKVEFQALSDSIGHAVDGTASTNENHTGLITFIGGNPNGTYIDPLFNDNPYTITLSASSVSIAQDDMKASTDFHENIHIWKPDPSINVTKRAVLDGKDVENGSLEIKSGTDFIIENKRLTVDLVYEYHCFIYTAKDA